MPPGPRPKPAALRLLDGNPGKRAGNEEEPKPELVDRPPPPPVHLTEPAKKEWRRVAKLLFAVNLLSKLDIAALMGYCVAYGRHIAAEAKLTQFGDVISTKSGNLIQSPYLGISNRALDQMRAFMVEFGMTPSSRTRVHASKPGKTDDDDFDDYLSGVGT